jgi:lincosamide nucleotidyltransferase
VLVLPQENLIARVGELCRRDENVIAALTYGSFPQGEGDDHSDIEFWLFFAAQAHARLDQRAWLDEVGVVRYSVVNEFGTRVAFFANLIRGEFHFARSDEIASVADWPSRGAPVENMILVDRDGALSAALSSLPGTPPLPKSPAEVDALCGRFANWLVLAHHVSRRGEILRAIDALSHAQRHLLWMARLAEGQTQHWLTPSRRAERELTARAVAAVAATAATAHPRAVGEAIAAAWTCGRAYWSTLANSFGFTLPIGLTHELDVVLGQPIEGQRT